MLRCQLFTPIHHLFWVGQFLKVEQLIVNLDNKQQFRFENAEYFMICQKTQSIFLEQEMSVGRRDCFTIFCLLLSFHKIFFFFEKFMKYKNQGRFFLIWETNATKNTC